MVDFIISPSEEGRTLVVSLCNRPYSISDSDPKFDTVIAAIKANQSEEEILNVLQADLKAVEAAAELSEGFSVSGGVVFFEGVQLDLAMGEYVVNLANSGFSLAGVAAFARNLRENPSFRAVRELYSFLRKGKNALTEDGHFLAYKRIRGDYLDVHSGSVLNKPAALLTDEERAGLPMMRSGVTVALNSAGEVELSMPRNAVDEDSSRTCSAGLHVCSFDYLANFSGERVVVCKVNPRDVVSIPQDYNDTKMRVCRYQVVAELPEMRKDVLGTASLQVDDDADVEVFLLQVRRFVSSDWNTEDSYSGYEDACTALENAADDEPDVDWRVINRYTQKVLQQRMASDSEDFDTSTLDAGDDDEYVVVTENSHRYVETTEQSWGKDLAMVIGEVIETGASDVVKVVIMRDGEEVQVLRRVELSGD